MNIEGSVNKIKLDSIEVIDTKRNEIDTYNWKLYEKSVQEKNKRTGERNVFNIEQLSEVIKWSEFIQIS